MEEILRQGFLFALIISIISSFIVIPASSEAQIWMEDEQGNIRVDFEPDENVYIRGSGFNSNAQIDISITRPDDNVENYSASSDENGCFLYIYTLDGMLGTYYVTVTDGINSASTDFDDCQQHLEGYDKAASRWERGLIEGWKELDWVPYRIKFKWLPKGTSNYNFNVYHNNLLGDNLGIDKLINFRVGDVNGNPVDGSVTVSGPFYKTPGKSCDRDIYYSLSVTFNTPSWWLSWYVYWDAHLAIGSSGWPGAKLHAYTDITGRQTVPIKVPPVPLGSISGSKWNDLSYDGTWDAGEPGLSGWTIQLDFFDSVENSWINLDNEDTGAGGGYTFSKLVAGNYRLTEVPKNNNWIQTYPPSPGSHSITLSEEENRSGVNFGNVSAVRDVNVSIAPEYQTAAPCNWLEYTVTVTNPSNVDDVYSLSVTDTLSWDNIWLEDNTLLATKCGGENSTTLYVHIPEGAEGNTEDNIVVTAISLNDNTASAEDSCIAHVAIIMGVDVTISPSYQSQYRGCSLSYTVTVANTGNLSDTYDLTMSDNAGWGPTVNPTSITISPWESQQATLTVVIPTDVDDGTQDNITITATSQTDNTVSDSTSCMAQAIFGAHTDHLNDPTDNWPNDYTPMSIPFNGAGVTISPYITCTIYENCHHAPYYHPCKMAQTILTDNDWGDDNALYEYLFEDWIDFDFNDIEVELSGVTDTVYAEILIVAREAGWMNPFGVEITPEMTVRVKWSSTEFPDEHNLILGAGETASILLFNESNPGDNATILIYIVRGVNVSISPNYRSGLPCTWLEYEVVVSNTGDVNDSFDLTVGDNSGWGPSLLENRFENVPPAENQMTTLRVHVPENAIGCTEDNITVTATGTGVENSASCIAHAEIVRGVEVSILPDYQENLPGGTLEYEVTITNMGNVNDNYTLTASDNENWCLSIVPSIAVPAFENRTTTLTVAIPEGAEGCTGDDIIVTATGTGVENSASCIAHVTIVRGVEVSISPEENSGKPCNTLKYTVTVRNTGTVDEVFGLSWGDNAGWGDNISLEVGSLSVARCEGENSTQLSVHIPTCVEGGTRDNITVTATGTGVENSASCITHVAVVMGVEVEITPSYQSGEPCTTLDYTAVLRNTGNIDDVYDLGWVDNAGWDNVWLEDIMLSVARCGGENSTMLHVHIPENAEFGTIDNITVNVTSRTDNAVSDIASCVAHIPIVQSVDVSITPLLDNGLLKDVIITNTGNVVDSYSLTIEDNLGWKLMLAENLIENAMPGENHAMTLSITIPHNTKSGIVNEIAVTATSQENAEVSGSGSAQTIAIRSVEVSVSPSMDSGPPGERLTFIATVKNTGNVWENNYYLTKTDELGWLVTENFAWIPLAPDNSASVSFEVFIPENVEACTADLITVTATSQTDNTVSDDDNCVARAIPENAFTLDLVAGWNLVGFTGLCENCNPNPNNMFAGLEYYTDYFIYYWTAPGGPYGIQGPNQVVEDNLGYWIWINQDYLVCTIGIRPDNRDIYMENGWNLVSFPVVNENTTPNNIFTGLTYYVDYFIYYWTAPGGPYGIHGPDQVLKDNLGYWVWINQDKTVTVP